MERLQKIIARSGVSSRRKAEELIKQGRVTVNGKSVDRLGLKVDPLTDKVSVDGVALMKRRADSIYLLLNKPKGYLTTLSDPAHRPIVSDLLPKNMSGVFPVGRLDFDAEGLLIITNDGELTNKLIHPRYKVPKTYNVKIKGSIGDRVISKLERGVLLDDGKTLPAKIRQTGITRHGNSWVRVIVFEGRNRLIKRMFGTIGHPVMKLRRTGFGGVELGKLKVGYYRNLTSSELHKLRKTY